MRLQVREYQYKNVNGSFTNEIRVKAGRKAHWQWRFDSPLTGTEIKFNGSVEILKTITYIYELIGQHDYIGYDTESSLGFCWD